MFKDLNKWTSDDYLIAASIIIGAVVILICILSFSNTSSRAELRDQAIQDCINSGGKPFVENYSFTQGQRNIPVVHCSFGDNVYKVVK